jgi:hypothetical protein
LDRFSVDNDTNMGYAARVRGGWRDGKVTYDKPLQRLSDIVNLDACRAEGNPFLPIRCVQRPTIAGWCEVQALGSTVSKAPEKPWIIENPETLAVRLPRVAAANAVVFRWPIVMTEA